MQIRAALEERDRLDKVNSCTCQLGLCRLWPSVRAPSLEVPSRICRPAYGLPPHQSAVRALATHPGPDPSSYRFRHGRTCPVPVSLRRTCTPHIPDPASAISLVLLLLLRSVRCAASPAGSRGTRTPGLAASIARLGPAIKLCSHIIPKWHILQDRPQPKPFFPAFWTSLPS